MNTEPDAERQDRALEPFYQTGELDRPTLTDPRPRPQGRAQPEPDNTQITLAPREPADLLEDAIAAQSCRYDRFDEIHSETRAILADIRRGQEVIDALRALAREKRLRAQ